jgi:hypothetical protein
MLQHTDTRPLRLGFHCLKRVGESVSKARNALIALLLGPVELRSSMNGDCYSTVQPLVSSRVNASRIWYVWWQVTSLT